MGDEQAVGSNARTTVPYGREPQGGVEGAARLHRLPNAGDVAAMGREMARKDVVAHDLVQVLAGLSFVLATADAVLDADTESAREQLRQAKAAAEIAALLGRELRGLVRLADLHREPASLVDVADRALFFALPQLGPHVRIRRAFSAAPIVRASSMLLLRVMLNLLVVAAASLRGRGDGGAELRVQIDMTSRDARLQIFDNGSGDLGAVPHAAEALRIARALLGANDGRLDFESRHEVGGLALVTLPLAEDGRREP
jgi:C4-dicarboxylate-specific signal transduction histidine kinase